MTTKRVASPRRAAGQMGIIVLTRAWYLRSRLLLREIADEGQLEDLMLISLDDQ